MNKLMTVGVCAAVAAAVAFTGLAATSTGGVSASMYEQEGLVAQWDAIENAGPGLHDDSPTTWKDLCGTGVDFPMDDCTVGENSVVMPSANKAVEVNKSVWGSFQPGQPYTIEICWKFEGAYPTSPDYFTFQSDETYFYRQNETQFNITHLYNLNGKHEKVWGRYAYSTAEIKEASTISFTCDGQSDKGCCLYRNGGDARAQNSQVLTGDIATPQAVTRLVRANGNRNFTLTYYAIRIYDHVLTESERARNSLLDRYRFFGERVYVSPIDPVRYDGHTPVCPDPVVKDVIEDVTLVKGADYRLEYKDNTSAGTATLTVVGLNKYAGVTKSVTYTILPTYFASPNGADDAACTEQEPGSILAAVRKAQADHDGLVVLADGDYDCSAIDTGTGNGRMSCFMPTKSMTIRSASGQREKCRLVGGGKDIGTRFMYISSPITVTVCDLTFTNFYTTATYGATGNDDQAYDSRGGGVFKQGDSVASTLNVSNCVFMCDGAEASGGAISGSCGGSIRADIRDSWFEGCTAKGVHMQSWCIFGGGAVCGYKVNYSCSDSVFTNNSTVAGKCGGAVYELKTLDRCRFYCNVAGDGGGAVYGPTTISNCVFVQNSNLGTAWNGTGGCILGSVKVYDSAFSNNTAKAAGYCIVGASFECHRCVFSGHAGTLFQNTTSSGAVGGSLYACQVEENVGTINAALMEGCLVRCNGDASKELVVMGGCKDYRNCTFVNNACKLNGNRAGLFPTGEGVRLVNCIVLGDNTLSDNGAFTYNVSNTVINASPGVTTRIVDLGGSMINALSPEGIKFVGDNDKGLPYYSLQRRSPLVDKGDNAWVTDAASAIDAAGNPRVVTKGKTLAKDPNAIVDIGCYENQGRAPGLMLLIW